VNFGKQDLSLAQESGSLNAEWTLDQFCFDYPDAKTVLRSVKENPLLEKTVAGLQEENENLKQQLATKTALLEISEARRQMEVERADFYKRMAEAEQKLTDRYVEMNEKLQKQLDRKVFWEKVTTIIAVGVGVAIGLAF
jgi:Skp family chaperone for outer membrane proteins